MNKHYRSSCLLVLTFALSSCSLEPSVSSVVAGENTTVSFRFAPDNKDYYCPEVCINPREWLTSKKLSTLAVWQLDANSQKQGSGAAFTLYDDGTNGDTTAGDGDYAGAVDLSPASSGSLRFQVFEGDVRSTVTEISVSDAGGQEWISLVDTANSNFAKRIDVFGVTMLATSTVSDEKFLHAASVMAQYLDNNADGSPDNASVVNMLIARKAYLFVAGDESEEESLQFPDGEGQNLFAAEVHPQGSSAEGGFDATLEEVLHLITHVGYARVYPEIFAESTGSSIANAMDVARGGQFLSIPSSYPASAWYSYDDATCDYGCQVTEYFYWSLTSVLGAQSYEGRLDEMEHEWQLNTASKVESTDATVYGLLTNAEYGLPSVLPDGNYSATSLAIVQLP